jgi:hypothetical protein
MKHLLNGVAIAAVLAISAPAWAQNTNAPMTPAAPAPAKPMAKKPMAKKPMHMAMRHHWHHAWHHHWRHHAGGDAMTEQLNREELARIQGGNMSAPPPPPSPMEGPRPSSAH